MYIETLEELLKNINERSWIKHNIQIPFTKDISIEKVEYVEEIKPITCKKGNFYNKDTNELIGKSVKRRIYFVINNKDLAEPKIVPNIEWRDQ